ncbi:hypothetical protein ACFX11_035703 [Malus domestica]
MTSLWDQLALTEPKGLGTMELYRQYREEQRLVQFLMPLRDEFETLRSSILHRTPLPFVDSVLSELHAEEVRVQSQSHRLSSPMSNSSALVASIRPRTRTKIVVVGDECAYCKEKGHWKVDCPWKFKKPPAAAETNPPKVLAMLTPELATTDRVDDFDFGW